MRWVLSVTGPLLLASSLAAAAKSADGGRQVVALFLAARGKPDAGIVSELVEQLGKAAPEVRLVAHRALKKTLGKRNPDAVIADCRGGAPCLAKLGARVGAQVVLYGTLSAAGKGVEAKFVVVEVAKEKAVRRVTMRLIAPVAVAAAVAEKRSELFGAAPVEEIPLEAVLTDGPLVDPGETEEPLGNIDLALIPMTEPEPAVAVVADAPGSSGLSPRLLTWAGVACGGLGLAGVGAGAYFGATYRTGPDEIERGPGGTSFPEAVRIYRDAESTRQRANLLLIGGSALAVVGAAMVGVDLLVLRRDSSAPRVSGGTSGMGAWVRLAW